MADPTSPDTSLLPRVRDGFRAFRDDLRTVLAPSGPEISPITGHRVDHLDAGGAGKGGFASALGTHGVIVALILFGVFAADEIEESGFDLPGLVFLVEEGPGGGGGGGGDETEAEPLAVETVNTQNVPEPQELVLQDPEATAEEILEDAIDAPFAPDPEALAGLIRDASDLVFAGPGRDRGAGTGQGGGLGEGDGDGMGEGTGGGFGGGAYRIGSGVEPPQLRTRVTPEYTDDALARKIEGIVILEVVILKSGRIGPARVIRSLDAGLDAKAVAAVRNWIFVPGRFRGEAVDVLAEIEVEFRLL